MLQTGGVETGAPADHSKSHSVARRGPGRLLPARLGEYELFDHIGRGGMADIYRARKTGQFGIVRQVVVKEILPELADSGRLFALLAEEAKTASRLEHTNVVRIEDLQRDESTLFIAMEYVEGLDLRELLRRCARRGTWIAPEIGLRVVIELLRALDYAHRFRFEEASGAVKVGIVHRDVSPSNVLLSFDGEIKLCDFGIARSYDGSEDDGEGRVTLEGLVEGKAGYMSPEQARGETLDGRADVFAAGIVLWELMSARKLYKAAPGETLFDVARRGHARPLPERGLPEEGTLRALLRRALADNPGDRYQSAAEMLRAVEAYAAEAGLQASSIRLSRFLEQEFAADIREAQRRRELATRALAAGPVATLETRDPGAGEAVALLPSPTPPQIQLSSAQLLERASRVAAPLVHESGMHWRSFGPMLAALVVLVGLAALLLLR